MKTLLATANQVRKERRNSHRKPHSRRHRHKHLVLASPDSHCQIDTTRSQFSIEIQMADVPKPICDADCPSEVLVGIRTLYDLTFRLRYGVDVLLHSISLFKKIMRVRRNCNMSTLTSPLLFATCFYISAKLLETRIASPSQLIAYTLYAFTKDELLKSQEDVLEVLDFDVCCTFPDRSHIMLSRELAEIGIRVDKDEWPLVIFS